MSRQHEETVTVLVIDDEEDLREACRQVLAREGYQVVTAADGETALEVARRQPPQVALVDLKIPKLPGMAVLDELGRLAPDCVKVVITAYATVSAALDAVRHGAYDFLPKPFTPEELRHVTTRALEHRVLRLENQRLQQEQDQARRLLAESLEPRVLAPLRQSRRTLAELAGRLSGPEGKAAVQALEGLDQALEVLEGWPRGRDAEGGD